MTTNVGAGDLVLGSPLASPEFEYSSCHGHFHYSEYSRYELLDLQGNVAAVGHKQAFCLADTTPQDPDSTEQSRYHCNFQGLQSGWGDSYDANLDCQWVDITDVPDGDYLLRVSVNPERLLSESNYDNNVIEVPVTIAEPVAKNPLEPCTTRQLGSTRECGWDFAPNRVGVACTPGESVRVGCGCPDGSCEGDPMLRVCKDDVACNRPSVLAEGDDSCGACPAAMFECPASGRFSVLVGSFFLKPISCEVTVEHGRGD